MKQQVPGYPQSIRSRTEQGTRPHALLVLCILGFVFALIGLVGSVNVVGELLGRKVEFPQSPGVSLARMQDMMDRAVNFPRTLWPWLVPVAVLGLIQCATFALGSLWTLGWREAGPRLQKWGAAVSILRVLLAVYPTVRIQLETVNLMGGVLKPAADLNHSAEHVVDASLVVMKIFGYAWTFGFTAFNLAFAIFVLVYLGRPQVMHHFRQMSASARQPLQPQS